MEETRRATWDAAIASLPVIPWAGRAWRFHGRRYDATDPGGSLKVTGRYHRGLDQFSEQECWPALYLALAPHVALGERLRHTTAETLAKIGTQRLSELNVVLEAVLDCCADGDRLISAAPGLLHADLCADNFDVTHALAMAARQRGVEALLVPSCTRFRGGNLVLFPDMLRPESKIEVVQVQDPTLLRDS